MTAPDHEPIWEIETPVEKVSGWRVHVPFWTKPDFTLVCHAIRGDGNDGGYIALAIRDGITLDNANYQSNPPEHGYGHVGEEDGA